MISHSFTVKYVTICCEIYSQVEIMVRAGMPDRELKLIITWNRYATVRTRNGTSRIICIRKMFVRVCRVVQKSGHLWRPLGVRIFGPLCILSPILSISIARLWWITEFLYQVITMLRNWYLLGLYNIVIMFLCVAVLMKNKDKDALKKKMACG